MAEGLVEFPEEENNEGSEMYVKGEKLKRISDTIFQEGNPPADRSKPLEWRRSFNSIFLTVRNLRVINSFNVNEVDSFYGLRRREKDAPEVVGKANSNLRIEGIIDPEEFRDTILFSVASDRDDELYELERTTGAFRFQVRPGEPMTSEDGQFVDVYAGHIGRADFEPGQDGIWLELHAPENCVKQIAEAVSQYPDATLTAQVSTRTFSYEVDDALREHYHRRDLFVHDGMSVAFLENVHIETSAGFSLAPAPEETSLDDWDTPDEEAPRPLESGSISTQAAQMISAVRGVKIAVYVAAVAVILTAFLGQGPG